MTSTTALPHLTALQSDSGWGRPMSAQRAVSGVTRPVWAVARFFLVFLLLMAAGSLVGIAGLFGVHLPVLTKH